MGSAISTPTFQAVNANIANDGTADSPRGFANITTTGTFTVSKTGASLYRVAVTSPAAPITATLPTDVKAGYRVRFEVELTSSTETNCFFTSPAIAEAQINGTGFVELMAKIDNPSVAGDWKVVDVEENCTLTNQTYTFGNGGTITNRTLVLTRKGKVCSVQLSSGQATGSASNSGTLTIPFPTRFRSSAASYYVPVGVVLAGTYQMGLLNVNNGAMYSSVGGSLFSSAASLQGFGFSQFVSFALT